MRKLITLCLVCAMLLLPACQDPPAQSTTPSSGPSEESTHQPSQPTEPTEPTESTEQPTEYDRVILQPYDDLSALGLDDGVNNLIVDKHTFTPEDIFTYSFDDAVFEDAEDIQAQVLEAGKNPGLGVRELHAQGITGQGVNVAIIDQHLLLDHPEYADSVADYYDSGCGPDAEGYGSMHAPAVMSILAGNTLGVAPDAKVYFAAAPSWEMDSAYFADCLYWIMEQNKSLPENEKIRLVSVSAAPQDGWFENGDQWTEAVAAAQAEGILVLDCRDIDPNTGFVFAAYYDPENPEDVTACQPGFPNNSDRNFADAMWEDVIFAPTSYRTSARGYLEGDYYYGYDSIGGQSWAVPYVAGVLALGWQVNPSLDAGTMKDLLYQSCYINSNGNHIINPCAFIELVEGTL